jgi:hypothetical protein
MWKQHAKTHLKGKMLVYHYEQVVYRSTVVRITYEPCDFKDVTIWEILDLAFRIIISLIINH